MSKRWPPYDPYRDNIPSPLKRSSVTVNCPVNDAVSAVAPCVWDGNSSVESPTEELPAHSHTGSIASTGNHNHQIPIHPREGSSAPSTWQANGAASWLYTADGGTHTHEILIQNSGGGESHSILQPFEVIQRWKRTN